MHKLGEYAAATAAGKCLILNPKQAQASSLVPDPGGDSFWRQYMGGSSSSAAEFKTGRGLGQSQ